MLIGTALYLRELARPRARRTLLLRRGLSLALLTLCFCAAAQQAPSGPAVATPTKRAMGSAGLTQAPRPEAGPTWAQLGETERTALAPLAASWPSLDQTQKRKWLALAKRYPSLPAAQRQTIQSRMRDWATLSPLERTQARQNFLRSKQLATQDPVQREWPAWPVSQAWEAYSALPEQEKQKLANPKLKRSAPAAALQDPQP